MNVYDFDNTIYDGDSSYDFVLWLYRRRLLLAPYYGIKGIVSLFLYKIGLWQKEKVKEVFFSVFNSFENKEEVIKKFWDKHISRIKPFYLKKKKETDLVISASPLFIIEEVCDRLGIKCIASPVNLSDCKFKGKNCHGEEKVRRFKERYKDETIEEFYSDSYSDAPLAKLAEKAFIVKGNTIIPWKF